MERDRLLQLVNEETGTRGYVATADAEFLQIYRESVPKELADEQAIHLALFDMPVFWPALLRAHVLTQREEAYFASEVALVQAGRVAQARHDLVVGKGLFDELRRADALTEHEVITQLHVQQRHTLLLVRAGLAVGLMLCCVLIAAAIGFTLVLRRARGYRLNALSDPLTGAVNRRGAAATIDALTQAHDGRVFGLVFIDLDGFKKINDAYGHAAGDAILRAVAARLRAELREADEVCRLGGDEFLCIISPPTTREQLRGVAERLRKVVGRPYSHEADEYVVGCSVGISMYPQHGETPSVLLERADRAMYAAKNSGGGIREALL
jgi:diguanylate cyclase (GGDEF)-like protein